MRVKKSFCQQCPQWDSLGIWVSGSELENGENTKTLKADQRQKEKINHIL